MAALAACGSSHSGSNADAPGGGDGNGSNPDGTTGGPTTVTVTLTDRPTNAAMFGFLTAYQDGGGAWTAAPPPSGDTYSFPINSAAWGFAWTCNPPGGGVARVELAYFSITEKKSLTEVVPFGCTDRFGMGVQLRGTVTNLATGAAGGIYLAQFGNRTALVNVTNTTGSFMMNVQPGTHDLLIVHAQPAGGGNPGDSTIDAAAIARGVTVSGATTAPPVDFSTASNKSVPVTVVVSGNARIAVTTRLFSAGGTIADFARLSSEPFESDSLGTAATVAGDVYNQQISVSENGSTSTVQSWTQTIAAQTYAAPAALGGALATVPTATPYPEIATTWNTYSNAVGYAWDAQQGTTPGIDWTAVIGPSYLGNMPRFQMPDLSSLSGWSSTFAFQAGVAVNGSVTVETSSGGVGDFPPPSPAAAGTQRAFVDSRWTVTP
jgi:hypothetical protein